MKAAGAVRRVSRFLGIQRQEVSSYIPLLVRLWQEDGVWNVSASDLPIVVFDEDLAQARKYFADAIYSHFTTLKKLGKLEETQDHLIRLARENGFYEERIQPCQLFERINYSVEDDSLCATV
jgi:hypothetical protein